MYIHVCVYIYIYISIYAYVWLSNLLSLCQAKESKDSAARARLLGEVQACQVPKKGGFRVQGFRGFRV